MTWYNLDLTEAELLALQKVLTLTSSAPQAVTAWEPGDQAALDVVREKVTKLREGK